ncbi:RdgB/HAM1 family non-canonical purine NTP pyrophosphatase [Candidatus Thioglobus sp.]|uniref:RdgB/HAM1 family non-canonical purine NTP pyrophosphatase n=1 Tax=Candidatus Thioglobus sp. TaxID=2026721 RepID=UPI003D0D9B88
MTTLVLATGNPHKVKELKAMLAPYAYELKLQTEFFTEEVEEDGYSFIENALKKARYASKRTGLPALADDSGLEVDALMGAPGIYSARYSEGYLGQHASESLSNQKLLDELQGLPYGKRQACYYCAMVFVRHECDPTPLVGIGQWRGEILMQPKTQYGVGYDPIMWMPSHLKAASEIPMQVKNQVSHRAQALRGVLAQLLQVPQW